MAKLIHQVVFTFVEDVDEDSLQERGFSGIDTYMDAIHFDTHPIEHIEEMTDLLEPMDWDASITVEEAEVKDVP